MKSLIFDQFVDKVADSFSINPTSSLFDKSNRNRTYSDARYMIYYLCSNRKMRNGFIQDCMSHHGYYVSLFNIKHGIRKAKGMVENDADCRAIFESINNSITI